MWEDISPWWRDCTLAEFRKTFMHRHSIARQWRQCIVTAPNAVAYSTAVLFLIFSLPLLIEYSLPVCCWLVMAVTSLSLVDFSWAVSFATTVDFDKTSPISISNRYTTLSIDSNTLIIMNLWLCLDEAAEDCSEDVVWVSSFIYSFCGNCYDASFRQNRDLDISW